MDYFYIFSGINWEELELSGYKPEEKSVYLWWKVIDDSIATMQPSRENPIEL